jgi:hypothetical protein
MVIIKSAIPKQHTEMLHCRIDRPIKQKSTFAPVFHGCSWRGSRYLHLRAMFVMSVRPSVRVCVCVWGGGDTSFMDCSLSPVTCQLDPER